MHKPLHLLAAVCCAMLSYGQQSDSIVFLYKPDQYLLNASDKTKLDAFLLQNWDRLTIHSYTEETEGEEYVRNSRQVVQPGMCERSGVSV